MTDPMPDRKLSRRRIVVAWMLALGPWVMVAIGLATHWNAYVLLLLLLGGAVLLWTAWKGMRADA